MKLIKQIIPAVLVYTGLTSCGGSLSNGANGGGNVNPHVATQVLMLGNVTPIPVLNGLSSGIVPMIVTNNSTNQLFLKSATISSSDFGTMSATSSNLYVDTSQCSSVPANAGQCNVSLLGYGANPELNYTISMTFTDGNNNSYSASQIITYSDHIPVTTYPNGITMAMSSTNNNIYKAPSASNSITIPFVLGASYSDLSVSSAIPSIGTNLVCQNNQYIQGNTCYITASIANIGNIQTLSTNINLSSSNQVLSSDLFSNKIMANQNNTPTANPSTGVPITIVQNNVGNIITSAVNVVINPANGTAAQTVIILNNGNSALNNLTFSSTISAITLNTTGCSAYLSSLPPGFSCSFTVNANSSTSGQGAVIVGYNNGSTQNLTFNVAYISSAPSPLLVLSTGLGSFQFVPTGTTAYLPIVVTNQSTTTNTTFNNILFGLLPSSEFTYLSTSQGSSCSTTGSTSLTAGESCSIIIAYTPTTTGESSSFVDYATATYVDQAGTSLNYTSGSPTIPYSSINNQALVMILPNQVSYAIRADGVTAGTESFTIQNFGGVSTTIPQMSTSLFVPNTFPISINSSGTTCSTSGTTTLSTSSGVNPSCILSINFGPTTTTYTNLTESLQFNYKPYPTSTSLVTAYSFQTFNSSQAALLLIESISVQQTTGVVTGTGVNSGTAFGSGATPYYASPSNLLWATITYQNTGTESATNFNIALNNLPVGAQLYSPATTCPVGVSTGTLAPNGTCTVGVAIVNPSGSFNPYGATYGPLPITFPGWSYQDVSTGVNVNTSPSCTNASGCGTSGALNNQSAFYVMATPFATSVVATPGTPIPNTGTSVVESAVVKWSGVVNSGSPLTITVVPSGSITYSGTCTLPGTCTSTGITVTFPAYVESGAYTFSYVATPSGSVYPTGITGYFTIIP
jgi:hypothetical protein